PSRRGTRRSRPQGVADCGAKGRPENWSAGSEQVESPAQRSIVCMPGPQCASCAYSIEGFAAIGLPMRCPECGYEQVLRASPGEVKVAGAWFSSFLIGAAIPFGAAAVMMLSSLLLPTGE